MLPLRYICFSACAALSLLLSGTAAQDDCNDSSLCDNDELLVLDYPALEVLPCNEEVTPTETADQPTVTWEGAEDGKFYLLLYIDPDVPSCENQAGKYYRHWAQGDIPGENLRVGSIEDSTELTSYAGPAPPPLTGLHRYQWVLYEQIEPTSDMVDLPGAVRIGWQYEEFIVANGLEDNLVASFQFRSQNEG